jgi:hypothetical protein
MDWPAVTRRRNWLTAFIAVPAIVVSLGLSGLETWRAIHPRSSLFTPPFAYSLADAIATGNLQRAYQYIRAGQDPNALIAVRHPTLTQRRWVLTSPLLWAVAVGNVDAVRMLLGYGAHVDRPAYREAICLAGTLGHQHIVRVLRIYGGGLSDPPCGDFSSMEPALLRVLAERRSAERQWTVTTESRVFWAQ